MTNNNGELVPHSASKASKKRPYEKKLPGWCEVGQKLFPGPSWEETRGTKGAEEPKGFRLRWGGGGGDI